jgi:shikimate dehydrogenase
VTISGATRLLGVWGCPVTHSRSPEIQNAAIEALGLDWVYVPFRVPPEDVALAAQALRTFRMVGANVTVPLKEQVAGCLDSIDPDAAVIGSINTIVNDRGHLRGYSTDGPGLMWDLKDRGLLPESSQPVFVWGAGGSAKAIVHALNLSGYPVTVVNRGQERAEQLQRLLPGAVTVLPWASREASAAACGAALLINTTSLGMSPQADAMPFFSDDPLRADAVVYDLIYAPAETCLLRAAALRGLRVANGMGMLIRQAALSLSLWSGVPPEDIPVAVMEKAVLQIHASGV